MPSEGRAADDARREFREIPAEKGHSVDVARRAIARLERAFADGALQPTPPIEQAIADLRLALTQDDDQKLGGKSAEAARIILRAIERDIDAA